MAAKPIKVEVTGDSSKFDKTMAGVRDKLGSLGKVAAVGGLAIAGGLAAGSAALFKIGSDFDEMRNNIVKGTGASGEALDGLFDSAKNVMGQVPDSGALVSTVLADVNTFFGSTGAELEGLSESFLDFARLTGMDASAAVDGLDGIMTTFNLTVGDSDELMGDLIRISQATGVSMEELVGQVDKWGPSFEEAGLSAEEAAAMVGKFNVAGLDIEAAGKSFNKFLLDAAGNGLTAEEAMANLDAEMSGLTNPERLAKMEAIFGAKNAQAALTAFETGALALDDFNGLLGEGAGVLDEQTEATATFSDKWNEFKNKVLVKLEPLATKLFDALERGMGWMDSTGIPAVEKLVGKFQEFSGWVKDNQDYIIGALAALGTLVAVVLAPAFVAWAVAAGAAALATVLAAAPVIAITVAVAALAVGIIYLYKHWDEVFAKIKEIASRVGGAVVDFLKAIPGKIMDLGSSFLEAGKSLGGKILSGIKDGLTAAVGFAGDVASGLWKAVKNAVNTNVIDKINNAIPNSIVIPGPFPDIDLPDNPVPRLASGSRYFRGGLALVGEQGPELVAMPRGSRVFTARETSGMGDSGPVSVTVNARTNADPRAIAQELGWVLRTRGR